jgi:hypothetical protein
MSSAAKRSDTKFKAFLGTLRRGARRGGEVVHQKPDIELKVHIAQDEESGVWYIAASDIPGLRVEADSADELIRKVEDVAADLLELNLEEVAANVAARQRKRSPKAAKASRSAESGERPRTVIRPVFDSPLAVAC